MTGHCPVGSSVEQSLRDYCKGLQPQIVEWRRAIHRRPEVGMDLPETVAMVRSVLESFGVEVPAAKTGVVGLIKGERPGGCFAIRADMDALPIVEDTGLPFASEKKGAMHACGHDAHIAMVLGVAKALSSHRRLISGTVKLLFQPGEEGYGGALSMIEEGVLTNPKVDAIVACHVGNIWPESKSSGRIGVRFGPMMASTDTFLIHVKGKGGHGAMPHLTVDSIVVGAQIVVALQNIVSREVKPTDPAVVTVGKFTGGFAENVIAHTVDMEGTIRAFNPSTREYLKRRVEEVCKGIAATLGADVEVSIKEGYPPTVNNDGVSRFIADVAADLFGPESVAEIPEPSMGAEDMAYFLQRVPGALFGLGTESPDKPTSFPHHNPKFDIDEDVLWRGSAVMAEAAVRWLSSPVTPS